MQKLFIYILVFYSIIPCYSQTSKEYLNKGVRKVNLQDYRGAIVDYNKAIELNPNYADAYYNKGIAKTNLQDYQGAIEDYNKAIELNSNFENAYYNRGIDKIKLSLKDSGCLDLSKAGELGDKEAYDMIKKYCN